MKKFAYVYKTEFTDGRDDFYDVVIDDNEDTAYFQALEDVRNTDEGTFGLDHEADVEIVCKLASCPKSIAETIKEGGLTIPF